MFKLSCFIKFTLMPKCVSMGVLQYSLNGSIYLALMCFKNTKTIFMTMSWWITDYLRKNYQYDNFSFCTNFNA